MAQDLNFQIRVNHENATRSSATDSLAKCSIDCDSCQVGIKINDFHAPDGPL